MLEIDNTIYSDFDLACAYYEPYIARVSYMVDNVSSREDCRQELRIKLWNLFLKTHGVYNINYVKRRLRWDVINFLNRDSIYNFSRCVYLTDNISEFTHRDDFIEDSFFEKVDNGIYIESLLSKCTWKFSKNQYEALILFLADMPNSVIRDFFGFKSRNLTRYYLHLVEAIQILREEVLDGNTS